MPIFQTPEDSLNESIVAGHLEAAWGCEVHRFGNRSVIDIYASRNGEMTAIIEIKSRKVTSGTYPTVFLAMRKYVDLITWARAFDVVPIFVVKYEDCIKYINVYDVVLHTPRLGGNSRNLAANDIEPMIEVPVEHLVTL